MPYPPACTRYGQAAGSERAKRLQRLIDDHAFPKSDATFDVGGRLLRFGIIPGGAFVDRSIHRDVVVARINLPRSMGVPVALLEKLPPKRGGRVVVVAFNNDRFDTLC